MGNKMTRRKVRSKELESRTQPEDPFANKEPKRTDILFVGSDNFGRPSSTDSFALHALEQIHGKKKAILREHETRLSMYQTLTFPGFRLMLLPPRVFFSRMRDQVDERWRGQAHETADAFAYTVEIGNSENYFDSEASDGWEADRNQLNWLFCKPAVIENPQKPFLLILYKGDSRQDIDSGRVVNLLGLDTLKRPFRVIQQSTHCKESAEELEKAMAWVKKMVENPEEATAATGNMTDDDGSIDTAESAVFTDSYVLDYEPTYLGGNATLHSFDPIKKGTPCPFARASKLWGGKLEDDKVPQLYVPEKKEVEKAAARNAGPLAEFVSQVQEGHALDGFCVELSGRARYFVEDLGKHVCWFLAKLAELDPAPGENAMKMGPIDQPHWRFRYAGEDFFITTFSPCYPQESSRHCFGSLKAFMLFQPMTSFGRHGLVQDTPASETEWERPKTMRDKARVAFKANGCPYHIPETLPYPVAEHIVKPEVDDGRGRVAWWKHLEDNGGEN